MSTPFEPNEERLSTYVVADHSSEEEMIRLSVQDHLLTTSMGGVLPEQPDPTHFQHILDVGCATGNWLIELAKLSPETPSLVGIDISKKMVAYAEAQAEAQQVSDRVTFQVMDALRMLEFPDNTFDLVNQRIGGGYVRTWDWPRLLQEYRRVALPGGVIRITESNAITESNSAALTRLSGLLMEALAHAGHLFTPLSSSIPGELVSLLNQQGLLNIQTRAYLVTHDRNTAYWPDFLENARRAGRTLLPFMRKWTRVPDDYEDTYQQALNDMEQPDFSATLSLLTVWGINPPKLTTFSVIP